MPQIKIVSPTQGQTILGDKVTISFIVGDFSLGQDGYINLWLDNPIEESSTAAKITSSFDYTLSDLPVGNHKLTLEAIKPNNLPLSPKVKQSVSFANILRQIPTITPSPTPFNVSSLVNSINWQYILIAAAIIAISIGLIIKSTFGKPKIWK